MAERMNRTLVESVRSMLADAKLPHPFWAEALSTAVYLRNRGPTKVVSGMTPFEAWTKKKPSVSHLRVFGCEAFAHVPKDERGKLDSKARRCIFVGYGEETKGIASMIPRRKRYVSVVMYLLMKTSVALNVKSLRQEETSMFSWTSRVRMIHLLNP